MIKYTDKILLGVVNFRLTVPYWYYTDIRTTVVMLKNITVPYVRYGNDFQKDNCTGYYRTVILTYVRYTLQIEQISSFSKDQ